MSDRAEAESQRVSWPAVNPADADAARRAGMASLEAGTEIGALPLLDAARAFHPRDQHLWHVTGLLHRSLDDLAPAVGALEKAAALAPGNPAIAHDYARAAFDAGLPSVYLYELALDLAPLDGEVMLGLASARNIEEGPESALNFLDERLERHPSWIEGHILFARLSCIAGQRDRFAASLERALIARPRDHSLWHQLILVLVQAGLIEPALAAIRRARTAAGPHIAYDANEAVCIASTGRTVAADRLFDSLAEVRDLNLLLDRLGHLLRSGRPEQAAALAEPMLEGPAASAVAPYLSIAWRLLADSRWAWLEGDERLIGVYDLADRLPPLDRFAERLRALHNSREAPLDQSLRGGTQTHSELLTRIEPEIRALRRTIVQAVAEHIARLPPFDPRHPTLGKARNALIRFSGSWSVRLHGGGHHSNHVHPDGWLSSALYVALPPAAREAGSRDGWLTLGEPQAELGLDLEPFRMVEPKPGRLVLFPSTMWHGTRAFAEGERLTVAFDVAPPR